MKCVLLVVLVALLLLAHRRVAAEHYTAIAVCHPHCNTVEWHDKLEAVRHVGDEIAALSSGHTYEILTVDVPDKMNTDAMGPAIQTHIANYKASHPTSTAIPIVLVSSSIGTNVIGQIRVATNNGGEEYTARTIAIFDTPDHGTDVANFDRSDQNLPPFLSYFGDLYFNRAYVLGATAARIALQTADINGAPRSSIGIMMHTSTKTGIAEVAAFFEGVNDVCGSQCDVVPIARKKLVLDAGNKNRTVTEWLPLTTGKQTFVNISAAALLGEPASDTLESYRNYYNGVDLVSIGGYHDRTGGAAFVGYTTEVMANNHRVKEAIRSNWMSTSPTVGDQTVVFELNLEVSYHIVNTNPDGTLWALTSIRKNAATTADEAIQSAPARTATLLRRLFTTETTFAPMIRNVDPNFGATIKTQAEVESPSIVCRASAFDCYILQLGQPFISLINIGTGLLETVSVTNCTVLKNAAHFLTPNGYIVGFGGFQQTNIGTDITNRFFIARINPDFPTEVVCDTIAESPAVKLPPSRASAVFAMNGTDKLLMHGGVCDLMLPCGDFWSLDINTWNWTQLHPTVVGKPRKARQAHSMTIFEEPMTINGVSDTKWMAIAGGRSTVLIFDPVLYALTQNVLVELAHKSEEDHDQEHDLDKYAVSKPCMLYSEHRLAVFGGLGLSGMTHAARVYSFEQEEWGSFTIANWTGGPLTCSPYSIADAFAGIDPSVLVGNETSNRRRGRYVEITDASVTNSSPVATFAVAQSGPLITSINNFRLHMVSCKDGSNQIPEAHGQSCMLCPSRQIADGAQCIKCHSRQPKDYAEQWQRFYCIDGANNGSITAGFVMVIFIQLLLAPAVYVIVSLVRKTDQMRRDERDAANISEAVADMQFAKVAYLDDIAEPTQFQIALRSIVANVKRYRNFLPQTMLAVADAVIAQDNPDNPDLDQISQLGSTDSSRDVSHPGSIYRSDAANSDSSKMASMSQADKVSVTSLDAPETLMSMMGSEHDDRAIVSKTKLKASARVIMALKPRVQNQNCTVLVTNVHAFYRWCEATAGSRNLLAKRLTRLYDTIAECLRSTGGVIENVSGDKFLCAWHPVTGSLGHYKRAVTGASNIISHKMISGLGVEVAMGIASGAAFIGIAGGPYMRTSFLQSPIIAEATALCRLTKSFRCRALMEFTPYIQNALSDEFIFRILGHGYFDRNERTCLPKGETFRVARPMPQVEGRQRLTQTTVTLLAELVAPANDEIWVFEKKGYKEHIDTYNTIMRSIHQGNLAVARSLKLTGMPTWFVSELEEYRREGRLKAELVDCRW